MPCRSGMLTDIAPIVYKATKSGYVLDLLTSYVNYAILPLSELRLKRKATCGIT